MGKQINPAFLGNIAILAHKGFNVSQIAAATDAPYSTVRGALERYGIPFKNNQGRSKRIEAEYKQMIEDGGSSGQVRLKLAAKYGVCPSTVWLMTK